MRLKCTSFAIAIELNSTLQLKYASSTISIELNPTLQLKNASRAFAIEQWTQSHIAIDICYFSSVNESPNKLFFCEKYARNVQWRLFLNSFAIDKM